MGVINVLYEDMHLICVSKPYGVLSQGNENVKSLCDDIKEYLVSKGEKDTLYVLHRLDKTTGGAIVYAKTKLAASKMSELIAQNKLEKTYLCVTGGELEDKSATLTDLLYHDKTKNKTFVVRRERKGVKKAELCYEVLGTKECDRQKMSLVKVRLKTGRTHQIRVQFASRKHPLVGDRKYGSEIRCDVIALWSHSIKFVHPLTSQVVFVSCDPCAQIFDEFK